MKLALWSALVLLLASCGNADNKPEKPSVPAAPASVEAVKAELKSKSYEVEDVGFVSNFMGKEEPITWSKERTDTTKFFRDYIADRRKFTLNFVNDTAVKVVDEKKATDALYELEQDTSKAVLLNIKMEDTEFSFGGQDKMIVTYTYKIRGIGEKKLFLQTPGSMNRQEVVLLMKQR